MADLEREQYLATIAELTATVTQLSATISKLTSELETSNKTNEQLKAQQQALQAKIEELILSKKVRKNSHNSSIPPSMDGYKKPAPKSLRPKSDRSPGGQKGHEGHGMKITREPDEEIPHYPERCAGCNNFGSCSFNCINTSYEYEVEVSTKLIAHKQYACVCPLQNEKAVGSLPEGIKGTKQYGKGLKAFVAMLLTTGFVSVDRVHQILAGLGIQISTGTIQNILHEAATKTIPAVEKIKNIIATKKVIHADETGCHIGGKLHWLHCLCNPEWSFCVINEKRGSDAMEEIGIIPNLTDCTLIHDFWSPYLKFMNVLHGFCNTHLERELIYAYETIGQSWADYLNKLLSEMCGLRNTYILQGKNKFSDAEIDDFHSRYDKYVDEGLELNPVIQTEDKKRGRKAKGKTRCLLERLRDYKTDILRFLEDWSVPFTNNEAERCVRFAKVKAKVSGGFRSKDGADDFMTLISYLGSARKHDVLSYEALVSAFEGSSLALVNSWNQHV